MLTVLETTPEDLPSVCERLRDEDLLELKLISTDPLKGLSRGYALSSKCYTVVSPEGLPIILFGVIPLHDGRGAAWLTATRDIKPFHKEILKEAIKWLPVLCEGFDSLCNYALTSNRLHLKWLQAAGCTLLHSQDFKGHSFTKFTYHPEVIHV